MFPDLPAPTNITPVTISNEDLPAHTNVCLLGYQPSGIPNAVSCGEVTATNPLPPVTTSDGTTTHQLQPSDLIAWPGFSGSPVLQSNNPHVIHGIAAIGTQLPILKSTGGEMLFVPGSIILEFLKSVNLSGSPQPSELVSQFENNLKGMTRKIVPQRNSSKIFQTWFEIS